MMIGISVLFDADYRIHSNRESGDGRYDIYLYPRELRNPGIILELKHVKQGDDIHLKQKSEEALNQIEKMRYDMEMKQEGIDRILCFGIAFAVKKAFVSLR